MKTDQELENIGITELKEESDIHYRYSLKIDALIQHRELVKNEN